MSTTHSGPYIPRAILEPEILAEFGATLIAVSSLYNGFGRLFWGLLSDRMGRVRVFRILLASQMIVFGILMTERIRLVKPTLESTLRQYGIHPVS